MAGRGVLAYHLADVLAQGFIQLQAVLQAHEQHHPHIPVPVLADGHAFHNLFDLFHLAVDLRRANAHTARVEHGVGATVDHHAPAGTLLGVVALGPHPRKLAEVGIVVTATVRVVPETEWHRGEVARAHQLAFSSTTG